MSTSSIRARLTLVALLSATTVYFVYKSRRLNKLLRLPPKPKTPESPNPSKGKIFFISQTGTSRTLANRLLSLLNSQQLAFELVDPQNYEPEDLPKESLIIFIASTWEDGKAPEVARFFTNWLAESANDFRVGSLLLAQCKFAVFGVGSKAYEKTFNLVARDLSKEMRQLGAAEILPVSEGDMDGGDLDAVFKMWSERVVSVLKKGNQVGNGNMESLVEVESDFGEDDDEEEEEEEEVESEVVDLEDIAGKGPSRRSASIAETNGKVKDGKRDMVTPVVRASLEKQVCCFRIFLLIVSEK